MSNARRVSLANWLRNSIASFFNRDLISIARRWYEPRFVRTEVLETRVLLSAWRELRFRICRALQFTILQIPEIRGIGVMLFEKRLHLIAMMLVCCLESVASAGVIINGDFEMQPNFGSGTVINGAGYSGMTGLQIPGWTIKSGHAATVHDTSTYPFISGSYSINLDGEGFNGSNADMYQDFTSVASTAYAVAYDYQGWILSPTTFTVSITDLTTSAVLFSQTSIWTSSLTNVSGTFQGTGNSLRLNVSQQNTGFNDNAFIVDNFSVTTAAAVPEPSSMVLILTGGAFAYLRTRRRKQLIPSF